MSVTRRARGGSAAHLGLMATLARAHLAVVLPRSVWHGLGRLLRLPLISGSDIILEVELKVVHRRAFPRRGTRDRCINHQSDGALQTRIPGVKHWFYHLYA